MTDLATVLKDMLERAPQGILIELSNTSDHVYN
jgi:hypothetical protein